MKVTINLTKAQARAVLNSEGLTRGYGVQKTVALQAAEMRIIGAIQAAWNDEIDQKEGQDDD